MNMNISFHLFAPLDHSFYFLYQALCGHNLFLLHNCIQQAMFLLMMIFYIYQYLILTAIFETLLVFLCLLSLASSANRQMLANVLSIREIIYIKKYIYNNNGPSTLPSAIPLITEYQEDTMESIFTFCFLQIKKNIYSKQKFHYLIHNSIVVPVNVYRYVVPYQIFLKSGFGI